MFVASYRNTMASAKAVIVDPPEDRRRRNPRRQSVIELAQEWNAAKAAQEERRKREMDKQLAATMERYKNEIQQAKSLVDAANAALADRRFGFHPGYILKRISKATSIPVQEIKGPSRNREVVFARFAAIYWIRRKCVMSLPEIGKMLSGRDHTSILHGKTEYVKRRKAMGRTLRKVF